MPRGRREATTGTLLRRLLTALALAASLAFGLGPAAALGSASHPGEDACIGLADTQPSGPAHHHPAHQAACCGMPCVPALAADDAPVPPPDRMPSGLAQPASAPLTEQPPPFLRSPRKGQAGPGDDSGIHPEME